MARVITSTDVARRLGVSKTTVSKVFRNQPGISQITRDRVLQAAAELDYYPDPTRQRRGKKYLGSIGFMVVSEYWVGPDYVSYAHLYRMQNGCVSHCEQAGVSVLACTLSRDQIEQRILPTAIRRRQVDGMVVCGWLPDKLAKAFAKFELPHVMVDCDRHLQGVSQLQADNLEGVEQLVEHLTQNGAKRFATITGNMDHIYSRERLAGLQMALTKRRLELPQESIAVENDFTQEAGNIGMQKLLDRGIKFDAVVCQNDAIAYGALSVLHNANITVPDKVQVVGFDHIELRQGTSLTTFDPQAWRLGAAATKLLMAEIETGHCEAVCQKVTGNLILGQSTRGNHPIDIVVATPTPTPTAAEEELETQELKKTRT